MAEIDKNPKQICFMRHQTQKMLEGLVYDMGNDTIGLQLDKTNPDQGYISYSSPSQPDAEDDYFQFDSLNYSVTLSLKNDGRIAVMPDTNIYDYTIEIDSDIGTSHNYMHIITKFSSDINVTTFHDILRYAVNHGTYLPCNGCCTIDGTNHMVIGIAAVSVTKWQLIYGTGFSITDTYNDTDVQGIDVTKKPIFVGE